MKNIVKNTFILLILTLIIIKRPLVIEGVINGIDLWNKKVFPSIFPLLIVSDYILSTNLIIIISNTIGIFFSKIFKVSKYGSYVFLMSLFSGCPANAKYINDLLNNQLIKEDEAVKLLSMSLLYNPVLIISLTSFLKLSDSILLILFNIIINLLIGLFNRNKPCVINNNKPFQIKKFNIVNSISNAINTLLLILGAIVTFIIITSILPIKHPLINGIFEITNGLNSINNYDFLYNYKLLFSGILLSFGGLSIITQIKSIFKDASLDYSLFYKSRIIHLILFISLIYLKIICCSW